MKRLLSCVLVIAFFVVPACDKKSDEGDKTAPAAPAAPAAKAPAAPAAKAADMAQLALKAAEGWEGEFNKIMKSWTYEKYIPAADGMNEVGGRFYVDAWDSDMPGEAKAYAEKLKTKQGFQDMGYIWNKAEPKEAPGGWLILGESIDKSDPEAKAEMSFVAKIGAVSCRGSVKNKKLLDEAVSACQSIKP